MLKFVKQLNLQTIFCYLVEAGPGIGTGTIEYTMYLGHKSSCFEDSECLQVCKDEASDESNIAGARCMKFVGNFRKYCCCYSSTTNACCQDANSGIDCVPSTA